VTDGEFRRFSLDQVVSEIDGVEPIESAPVHFKSASEDWIWHIVICARAWACPPSGRSARALTSSTASAT
jgi:hypothetical protein